MFLIFYMGIFEIFISMDFFIYLDNLITTSEFMLSHERHNQILQHQTKKLKSYVENQFLLKSSSNELEVSGL